MRRPPKTAGLRHLALNVEDLDACEAFYVGLLGMVVEWRPDEKNLYLTSGCDNLALHKSEPLSNCGQHLDHMGFILRQQEDADSWYDFMVANNVIIEQKPRTHRDGARSFYCRDPEGNLVQMIYHPPIAASCSG